MTKHDHLLQQDLEYILEHTESLWQELKGERIFITGGTGFFGCWLLESFAYANQCLNLNATAVVLTRAPRAFRSKAEHLTVNPAIQFHIGDIKNYTFPSGAFSHVIHAATEASAKLNAENPIAMWDTILQGTQHTLEFAKHCGAKNFLLTSSGAVYGKQPANLTHISEDYTGAPDVYDPLAAYGNGKRAAEHLCALYAKQFGLAIKIARCFAFVGPYLALDIHFAIGNFIRDAMNKATITVNGDGTPCRSYLYAADLAVWLWTILFKGQSCYPYNVGSDHSVSITETAQAVAACFQPQRQVEIMRTPDPTAPVARYVPSVQRAQTELALTQGYSLHEMIKRTIEWNQVLI